MFLKPKFKLVCTAIFQDYQDYKVGDIITTADDQTHFGGPWGWMQDAGCAEWVENIPTDAEVVSELKQSKQSFIKASLAATDYKALKYIDGDITSDEYAPIKTYREKLRAAYRAIEVAATVEEVGAIAMPTLD